MTIVKTRRAVERERRIMDTLAELVCSEKWQNMTHEERLSAIEAIEKLEK